MKCMSMNGVYLSTNGVVLEWWWVRQYDFPLWGIVSCKRGMGGWVSFSFEGGAIGMTALHRRWSWVGVGVAKVEAQVTLVPSLFPALLFPQELSLSLSLSQKEECCGCDESSLRKGGPLIETCRLFLSVYLSLSLSAFSLEQWWIVDRQNW